MEVRERVREWAAPAVAATVLASAALAPAGLQPLSYGIASLVAALALTGVAALAARAGRGRRTDAPALAWLAPALALGASTAVAARPGIAAVGLFGQHSGWALTASLALTGVAALRACTLGSVGRTARVGATAGAVLAGAALLDAAGLLAPGAPRYAAEASGLLDNPASLAQLLLACGACAVACALRARGTAARAAWWACAALAVAGIAVAGVTGAWVALGAGAAAAYGLTRLRPTGARAVRLAAAGTAAALAAALAVAALLAAGVLGAEATAQAGAVTNGRVGIWRSVLARAATSPLLGLGPDQVTAVQSWTGTPAGDLTIVSTTDPHGSVVGLAAAGGALGLAAGLAAAFAAAYLLLSAHRERGLPPAGAALAGGAVAVTVASLASWTYAPAAMLAILTCAPLAAAGLTPGAPEGGAGGQPGRALAALTGAVALAGVACLAAWVGLAAPVEVASASAEPGDRAQQTLYARWPDPLVATKALAGLAPAAASGDRAAADALVALADTAAPESAWGTDAAFRRIVAYQFAGAATGSDVRARFAAAVDAGKRADPGCGVWDFAAVLEARRRGDRALAARHAGSALTFPLTAENRTWLRTVVAEGAAP